MKCHLLWVTHAVVILSTLTQKGYYPITKYASIGHFQVLRYFRTNKWRYHAKVVISTIPVSGQSVHFLPELRAALHDKLHALETASGRGVV